MDLYASLTFEGIRNAPNPTIGQRPLRNYIFRPAEELYDLEADPAEVRNLCAGGGVCGDIGGYESATGEMAGGNAGSVALERWNERAAVQAAWLCEGGVKDSGPVRFQCRVTREQGQSFSEIIEV